MITCSDPIQQKRLDEHLQKCSRVAPKSRVPDEKRQGIIALIRKGVSTSAIKRTMHASEITIYRIRKQVDGGRL